jgi:hypothetical protein
MLTGMICLAAWLLMMSLGGLVTLLVPIRRWLEKKAEEMPMFWCKLEPNEEPEKNVEKFPSTNHS